MPEQKPQTNYEQLELNRRKAIEYAESIASVAPSSISSPKLPTALNSMEDLTSAIHALDQQKDNKLGITWHEDDKGNRVRDARNVTTDEALLKKDAGEKYAMQVLNETRGGILLLEQSDISEEKKEETKAKLLLVAEAALKDDMDQLPSKIRGYNSALIAVLHESGATLDESGISRSAEQLNFAKEVANFQDNHKHIITLNSIEDNQGNKHTIVEADVMLNSLTDSQKAQYEAIAAADDKILPKKPDKLSLKSRMAKLVGRYKLKDDYAWYNKLPDHKRKLVKSAAEKIARGEKVIPAQLREFIGIRNGYEKTTALVQGGQVEILTQNIHCGAPASKNKEGKEKITEENLEQLQSFTNNGQVNLNILTSETKIRDESWISNQLKKASEKLKNISITSSPINRFRLWTAKSEQKHFEEALAKIGENLNKTKNTEKLQEYLKTGKGDLDAALKEIKNLNSEIQVGLMAAVKAREHLSNPNTLTGKNKTNSNVEISANMLIVETSLKNKEQLGSLFDQESKKALKTIITFCKSGKDRTGLVMIKATKLAASYKLSLNEEKSQQCLQTLAAGNHTQEMAGIQGGSTGCHSLKTSGQKFGVKGEFVLNEQDEIAMGGVVNQKSSGYNSEIKLTETPEQIALKDKLIAANTAEATTKKQEAIIAKQEAIIAKQKSIADKLDALVNPPAAEKIENRLKIVSKTAPKMTPLTTTNIPKNQQPIRGH